MDKNQPVTSGSKAAPLQLTHEQMKASLSRDLDTLAALINFIRSTPAISDLIAEYALGIQNNILNKKADESSSSDTNSR